MYWSHDFESLTRTTSCSTTLNRFIRSHCCDIGFLNSYRSGGWNIKRSFGCSSVCKRLRLVRNCNWWGNTFISLSVTLSFHSYCDEAFFQRSDLVARLSVLSTCNSMTWRRNRPSCSLHRRLQIEVSSLVCLVACRSVWYGSHVIREQLENNFNADI